MSNPRYNASELCHQTLLVTDCWISAIKLHDMLDDLQFELNNHISELKNEAENLPADDLNLSHTAQAHKASLDSAELRLITVKELVTKMIDTTRAIETILANIAHTIGSSHNGETLRTTDNTGNEATGHETDTEPTAVQTIGTADGEDGGQAE